MFVHRHGNSVIASWLMAKGIATLVKTGSLPVKDITDPNRQKRRQAIEILANAKHPEAAPLLAALLKEFHEQDWAAKELIKLGPEPAEKDVLAVMSHKMAMGKAKEICKEFKTTESKVLDQYLADIKDRRKSRKRGWAPSPPW
jgi:hypothetical protein